MVLFIGLGFLYCIIWVKNWLIDSLKAEPKLLWKIASESQKVFSYLLDQQEKEEKAA